MAEKTEPTFASVFTQSLGKGLAGYAVERQKAQDVGRENALMQYKMQIEQQERQQAQQESNLRMTQLRLRNQQLSAEMDKARIEAAKTPEQLANEDALKLTAQVSALKPLNLLPSGVKTIEQPASFPGVPNFDKLSAPVRDIIALEGLGAAKAYVSDARTNPALSEKSYQAYLDKVRTRNDALTKLNDELTYKNNILPSDSKLRRPLKDVEPILSYEEWRASQEQLLGITPDAATQELRKRGKLK